VNGSSYIYQRKYFPAITFERDFMKHATLLVLLVIFSFVTAGEVRTDSLENVLEKSKGSKRIPSLITLSRAYLVDSPAKSIDLASEALVLSREFRQRQAEAEALFCLAEASVNMNNLQESIPYYLQSAGIEKELHGEESEGYANRLGDAGYSYYNTDQFAKALEYLKLSLEISVRNGYDSQAASMYSNLGSIYTEWGNYAKGLENQLGALEIDRRSNDSTQIATDLNNIGKIYEQWGKFEEAIKYYTQSLDIALGLKNKPMIAIRYNNLGIVCKAQKHYKDALSYFQKALEIERETGNLAKVGRRMTNMAATYLEMGDLATCYVYLNQALPILTKASLLDDMARLYNLFGKYHQAEKQFRKAISFYRLSQERAAINSLKPITMANLQGLTSCYESMGYADSALVFYKQFVSIKDSIFTVDSDQKLAEYQAQFETEKMHMENEMLKKDAILKRDIFMFSAAGGTLLLAVLIAVIIILRLKARNSRQSRIMAEQEADRLRLDLELKNKELTCNAMSIIEKNETVSEVIRELEKAIDEGQPIDQVKTVFERIKNGEHDSTWNEFELRFTQVHKEFYDNLNQRFPELTPNERKLCAFLRLNMTTKDIAAITHQSIHSINVARTRLRKKLNLANSDENLISFLINL